MSLGPLYVFLGEMSVQVLSPFFNWVACLPGVELCEFFIDFGEVGEGGGIGWDGGGGMGRKCRQL